jgi:hypothetical protein
VIHALGNSWLWAISVLIYEHVSIYSMTLVLRGLFTHLCASLVTTAADLVLTPRLHRTSCEPRYLRIIY